MSSAPQPETAMLRQIRTQCLEVAAELLRVGTPEALAVRDQVNAITMKVQAVIDEAKPGELRRLPPGLLQEMGAVADRVQDILRSEGPSHRVEAGESPSEVSPETQTE